MSTQEWPSAGLRTVERVLAMRNYGLVSVVLMSMLIGGWIASITSQPRGLNQSCVGSICGPSSALTPERGTPGGIYLVLAMLVLFWASFIVFSYGPASGAGLNRDGRLAFYGGFLPFKPVPVAEIERISVGALYLRGLVFFHCGRSFPIVMLGPVDGLARLVEVARDRGISIRTDGV